MSMDCAHCHPDLKRTTFEPDEKHKFIRLGTKAQNLIVMAMRRIDAEIDIIKLGNVEVLEKLDGKKFNDYITNILVKSAGFAEYCALIQAAWEAYKEFYLAVIQSPDIEKLEHIKHMFPNKFKFEDGEESVEEIHYS